MRVLRSAEMARIRLAAGQIDHGEARRDLRARRALQPFVDLVLQKFTGLVEQIDRDQPLGEPPDHFVAAPPDRRQFTILVEHPKRVDGGKVVALRAQKQLREQRRRRILGLPRWLGIWLQPGRGPCRRKRFAVAPGVGVHPRHDLQRPHLDRVATPHHRKRFQFAQHLGLADFVALLTQHDFEQLGFGRRGPIG